MLNKRRAWTRSETNEIRGIQKIVKKIRDIKSLGKDKKIFSLYNFAVPFSIKIQRSNYSVIFISFCYNRNINH